MIDYENTIYYNTEIEEFMAESIELLNTTELNLEIENMFKKEKHFILILSPYLDLTDKIQSILSMSQAEIVIVYRETLKEKKIEEFMEAIPRGKFFSMKDFHAKAYITSGTMIITSLNLYEHSQIKNFELGIILRATSYNKMIEKLSEELKILFNINKHNIKILENLQLPTVNDLFNEILKKSNKIEKDFPDAKLFGQFSEQMINRYTFERKDRWNKDENMLQRWIKVNRHMYEWALENIRL